MHNRAKNLAEDLWSTYQRCYFLPISKTTLVRGGAIISLMVPGGKTQSPSLTANTIRRNLAQLHKNAWMFSCWYGGNVDMSYREYSALVACSLSEARRLSAQFGQNAFYWLENDKLNLVETKSLRQTMLPYRFSEARIACPLPKSNQAVRT